MTRIWPSREDGIWLYVEQAAASALDRPYRQRVYKLGSRPADDGGAGTEFVSEVFELPGEPLDLAGAWSEPSRLDVFGPGALNRREGCAVVLRDRGDRFVGSTVEHRCVSALRGASYATSEVTVTPDGITSWDRGFDAAGAQVWGAEKGPYEFVKSPAAR